MTSSKFLAGTSIGNWRFPDGTRSERAQILGGWIWPLNAKRSYRYSGRSTTNFVAELIEIGASGEDLREAWGWLHNDEALVGAGRPLPGTRVGKLIELLEPDEDET